MPAPRLPTAANLGCRCDCMRRYKSYHIQVVPEYAPRQKSHTSSLLVRGLPPSSFSTQTCPQRAGVQWRRRSSVVVLPGHYQGTATVLLGYCQAALLGHYQGPAGVLPGYPNLPPARRGAGKKRWVEMEFSPWPAALQARASHSWRVAVPAGGGARAARGQAALVASTKKRCRRRFAKKRLTGMWTSGRVLNTNCCDLDMEPWRGIGYRGVGWGGVERGGVG